MRTAHLFADLPKAMIDPAFLDRLHYYLPGWEIPKLEQRLFTGHSRAGIRLPRRGASGSSGSRPTCGAIDGDFALGAHLSARDEKCGPQNGLGAAQDPASACENGLTASCGNTWSSRWRGDAASRSS